MKGIHFLSFTDENTPYIVGNIQDVIIELQNVKLRETLFAMILW